MKPVIAIVALILSGQAMAQTAIPVTVDNFVRAESDTYIGSVV
jgi:hypothetical protein